MADARLIKKIHKNRHGFLSSIRQIKATHNISTKDIVAEITSFVLFDRKLSFSEYRDATPIDLKNRGDLKNFIGADVIVGMNRLINRRMSLTTRSSMNNKLLLECIIKNKISAAMAPVTQLLYVERGLKLIQNTASSASEFAAFLRARARYPLFGKPLDGLGSLGAASIDRYDPETDTLQLLGGDRVSVEAFAEEVARHYPDGYLLQDRIRQHPDVVAMSGDTVSSLRIVTYRDQGEVKVAYACWKVAAPHGVADNSWRPGSAIVALDPDTGVSWRAQMGYGLEARLVDRHEASGTPLIGVTPPHWAAARAAALRASALFEEATMLGWDVALGVDGPILIEGNRSPNHVLYQRASGRGVLTTPLGPLWERRRKEAKASAKRRSPPARTLLQRLRKRAVSLFAAR